MRREAVWEYLRGALWVLPTIAVVVALVVGYVLSQVEVSSTRWFVFQGTTYGDTQPSVIDPSTIPVAEGRPIRRDQTNTPSDRLFADVAGVGALGLPSDIEINLDSDERLLG